MERSSKDSQAVITTYEGKHNHDVPAARNSNHDTNNTSSLGGSHTTYEKKHSYDVHAARNNNHDTSRATAATFPPPAGPFHTGLVVSTSNTLSKPSPSLQEQFFGKLLEDTYKLGDKMAVGMELGRGSFAIGSGLNSRPLEGSDFLGQNLGLRPKQEPGDVQPVPTFF